MFGMMVHGRELSMVLGCVSEGNRNVYHRFQPRFAGEYGKSALIRLEQWMDDLFAATMTMYKREAQKVCRMGNMTSDCSAVRMRFVL